MLYQIAIGSLLIVATIVAQAAFITFAIRTLQRHRGWLRRPPHLAKLGVALAGGTLVLLAGMAFAVWLWTFFFQYTGAFNELETALYFALVSFTTLGFGDIILPKEHRLLSGMLAANGLILFGLTTAFLIEFMQRLYKAQSDYSSDD